METLFGEYNLLIPLLIFGAVISLGGAVISGMMSYKNLIKSRLEGVAYDTPENELKKSKPFSQMVSGFGSKLVSKKGESSSLRTDLARAGYSGQNAVAFYLGIKMLLLIGALIACAMIVVSVDATNSGKILIVLIGASAAFFLPNIVLRGIGDRRSGEIRGHLPDAIDLLEICVSGGMGIDQAWNSVSEQMRHVCPLLADEMALTNLEIHLGAPRADAMRHMAERTGSDDITSLVGVLIQSEKFGTSIGEALRVFTITMREQRSFRAEESAEKMSVKMLFPMVIMIFPVVIIIAVGPAALSIREVFGM